MSERRLSLARGRVRDLLWISRYGAESEPSNHAMYRACYEANRARLLPTSERDGIVQGITDTCICLGAVAYPNTVVEFNFRPNICFIGVASAAAPLELCRRFQPNVMSSERPFSQHSGPGLEAIGT